MNGMKRKRLPKQPHCEVGLTDIGQSVRLQEKIGQSADMVGRGVAPRIGHRLTGFAGPRCDRDPGLVGPAYGAIGLAEKVEGGFGRTIQRRGVFKQGHRLGCPALVDPDFA